MKGDSMWIKLKSAVGTHKVGELIQVEASVAKAYIDAGLAEDAGEQPSDAIKAIGLDSLQNAMKGFNEGMAETFKTAAEDFKKGVKFHTIEPGEQQADKTKSLGDFVKNIVRSANFNDFDGAREAQDRLVKTYGSEMKKSMTEGTGSTGGFWTTPTLFEKTILKEAWENSVILPGTTNVPLGARSVEWPALDQYKVPTPGTRLNTAA